MTAGRVMRYLEQAELSEDAYGFESDIRQAWITVSLAARGECGPFVQASYRLHGLHPDKVWPAIMAQRRATLGKEFSDWYDAAGNLKPDIPGKKPIPVREAERHERLASVA